MSDSNCWLQDINVQKQLEDYFADVDQGLSTFYETHPKTGEPQLDGHLAARLEREDVGSLRLHLERIERERTAVGLRPITLTFNVMHITSEEIEHGADLGFVARLELPGEYTLAKAVLVQTKRLHPSKRGVFSKTSTYPELFKHRAVPQWKRMLEQTPACVYFLYNPYQLRLKRRIQRLGTRVVSAQHIAGIAHTRKTREFTAQDAFERGKPLAKWLVGDFICCHIGDTREEVVETALGRNVNFPVRSTIEMIIEGGTINLSLWDQNTIS